MRGVEVLKLFVGVMRDLEVLKLFVGVMRRNLALLDNTSAWNESRNILVLWTRPLEVGTPLMCVMHDEMKKYMNVIK